MHLLSGSSGLPVSSFSPPTCLRAALLGPCCTASLKFSLSLYICLQPTSAFHGSCTQNKPSACPSGTTCSYSTLYNWHPTLPIYNYGQCFRIRLSVGSCLSSVPPGAQILTGSGSATVFSGPPAIS